MKTYIVETGPCCVGHIFTESEVAKWVGVMVTNYAKLSGLDVHPAEASVRESHDWPSGARVRLECHVGGQCIATLRARR